MMMTCAAAAATAQGNGRLDSYTIDENDFNEENCIEGMASEFNEESAQKKKRPAASVEKMVIKDGETIHLNKAQSPRLMKNQRYAGQYQEGSKDLQRKVSGGLKG